MSWIFSIHLFCHLWICVAEDGALRSACQEGVSLLARFSSLTTAKMQRGGYLAARVSIVEDEREDFPRAGICATLTNHITYSTIDVEVGTPGQTFSIIADTGSNSLIIPSCICQEMGHCYDHDRCFRGKNRSSTFHFDEGPDGPTRLMITFGSGTVTAVLVSDIVTVGHEAVNMSDGLLLMIDQALDFGGSFEGIMGLGQPLSPEDMAGEPPSFMEQAKLSRFSICFNDHADGALRFGTGPLSGAHDSVGMEHWGLALESISVGDSEGSYRQVQVCLQEDMKPGQDSPCGIIPDSGTTDLMAPQEQIDAVKEEICNHWPRCKENFTALEKAVQAATEAAEKVYGVSPFNITVPRKGVILELLLADCNAWMAESTAGLEELPVLRFEVRGSGSASQQLELPGSGYVMMAVQEERIHAQQELPGVGAVFAGIQSTGRNVTVCTPAFGAMEYTTEKRGPVWILGTPLFYEYTVAYDVATKPPTMSFTSVQDEACGSCRGDIGLATTDAVARRPRRREGPPRVPNIDVMRPL